MFEAIRTRAAVVIRKAFGALMSTPYNPWGLVRESFAGAWQRGVTIDDTRTLLSFAAVYACVTRIASDIAKLRLRLVALEAGIWSEVAGDSPFWRTLIKPNNYQNRIQFITAWIVSKLLHGNAFIFKEREPNRGMVKALHVLDPRRVTPLITPEGDVFYTLGGEDLSRTPGGIVLPASEIIHDRTVTLFHALIGTSPIYACGAAGTQGNRIQANSAKFFENMSRPSGVMTAPGTIDQVTADRVKKDWEQNFSADNIGRLAILGDGLTYEAMTIPAGDAQLIEQLRWTGEDVARAFGVPGYKIGVGQMPTNNNVEALEQQYYSGCLQILIEAMELCLDEGLEITPGMGTEFDLDGLLRMDSATQYDALGKAVGAGVMAPNEARAKINLKKVPGGDTPYLQEQNWPLAQLADRPTPTRQPTAPAPLPPVAIPAPAPAPAALPGKSADEVAREMAEALIAKFSQAVYAG